MAKMTDLVESPPIGTSVKLECFSEPKCEYFRSFRETGTPVKTGDPHQHEEGVYEKCSGPIASIYDSILDHIGMTPLVRLNKIPQSMGIEAEILVKCEYFNAGGSVKDRIGKRMILDAERDGRLKPGATIIEATSGNTGIGLALTAAVRGYKMIVTLPDKMSDEKVYTLQALGAKVIRTPASAAFDSPDSHICVAAKLQRQIPGSVILDQYSNPSNPLAHYDGTAEEILKQCKNKIDMLVCTPGTGGTLSGCSSKIKERLPNCTIIGGDPHGSILARPKSLNIEGLHGWQVEGNGQKFDPKTMKREPIDEWIKTRDKEAFLMARRMIREEGLLCGSSAGSALCAALRAARTLKKGQRVVVLLPDSVRNYMTKFLSDDWMVDNGYLDADVVFKTSPAPWWHSQKVRELRFTTPTTISDTVSVKTCVDVMDRTGLRQLPVWNGSKIVAVADIGALTVQMMNGRALPSDVITSVVDKKFKTMPLDASLLRLSSAFKLYDSVLVTAQSKHFVDLETVEETKEVIVGILTKMDLLKFITHSGGERSPVPADDSSASSEPAWV